MMSDETKKLFNLYDIQYTSNMTHMISNPGFHNTNKKLPNNSTIREAKKNIFVQFYARPRLEPTCNKTF